MLQPYSGKRYTQITYLLSLLYLLKPFGCAVHILGQHTHSIHETCEFIKPFTVHSRTVYIKPLCPLPCGQEGRPALISLECGSRKINICLHKDT